MSKPNVALLAAALAAFIVSFIPDEAESHPCDEYQVHPTPTWNERRLESAQIRYYDGRNNGR